MRKNKQLYYSVLALVKCSKHVKLVDENFAQILLNKAQEYKNQIIIDEDLEKEINEFEQRIKNVL